MSSDYSRGFCSECGEIIALCVKWPFQESLPGPRVAGLSLFRLHSHCRPAWQGNLTPDVTGAQRRLWHKRGREGEFAVTLGF